MPDQTPVTDDDRKAHQFSDNVLANPGDFGPDSVATARAVKVHVPAPPATLADELRRVAGDVGRRGLTSFKYQLEILADRAEAVEKENRENTSKADQWEVTARRLAGERDEARDEVQKVKDQYLTLEVDHAALCHENGLLAEEVDRLKQEREQQEKALTEHGRLLSEARAEVVAKEDEATRECHRAYRQRDAARAEASSWKTQRDEAMDRHADDRTALAEARGEVERLSDELDKAKHGDWLKEDLPDPADVPMGEAWIVEVEGEEEHLLGLRNCGEPHAWETFTLSTRGSGGWCADTAVTLIARLAPDTRRVIDRPEDLDARPADSVVLDGAGRACQKASSGKWRRCDGMLLTSSQCFGHGPVTVIHELTVDSGSDS